MEVCNLLKKCEARYCIELYLQESFPRKCKLVKMLSVSGSGMNCPIRKFIMAFMVIHCNKFAEIDCSRISYLHP